MCFIGGAPHSGSTLLGMILGAHAEVVYGGELRKSAFLGDESRPLKKRVCKLCGPSCPVWGDLRQPLSEDIYEVLARRTGRSVVVDSSKSTEWQSAQLEALVAAGVRTTFVYLRRDGRAILASRMRKYPQIPAREIVEDWIAQIARTDALAARFPGEVIELRYEDLATRPEPTIRELCRRLGLSFDPSMLRFWDSEQHPLGGNDGTQFLVLRERARRAPEDERSSPPSQDVLDLGGQARAYYDAHPAAIVLDLRWQRELASSDAALFDARAGEINRPFTWPPGNDESRGGEP